MTTVTSPPGRLLRDAQGARLEFIRSFDAAIEDVWSALTDSDRLARWYGSWAGDPASGTVQVLMTAEEGATPEPVRILTCEAPTTLVVEMTAPDGDWRLEVTLKADGEGTTLQLSQRLAEPLDASSIGPGWHFYLDRLGAVVARTTVPDDWDAYYGELTDRYAVPPV